MTTKARELEIGAVDAWTGPDERPHPAAPAFSGRRLWPPLLLTAVLAVVVINLVSTPGGEGVRAVSLAAVEVGSLEVETLATGTVEPRDRVELRYPYETARVAEIWIEPGQEVVAGQPLVALAPEPLLEAQRRTRSEYLGAMHRLAELSSDRQATSLAQREIAVERARKALEFEQKRLLQYRELHEAGLVANVRLTEKEHEAEGAALALREAELALHAAAQDSRAEELASAEAEVRYRELALERTRAGFESRSLKAPAEGTILEIPVGPGAVLHHGDLVVAMADMRRFVVCAMVDELEVGNLRPGQRASVRSEYFGAEVIEGTVERILPAVRSFRGVPSVEVRLAVAPGRWSPPDGLTVDVRIHVDQAAEGRLVPIEAIVERQGENVVFVYDGGKARRRAVRLGLRNRSSVEILDGLERGEQVIVGGHVFLTDGEAIRPLEEGSSGALKVEFFNG